MFRLEMILLIVFLKVVNFSLSNVKIPAWSWM